MINHQNIDGDSSGFQAETELLLHGRENRRKRPRIRPEHSIPLPAQNEIVFPGEPGGVVDGPVHQSVTDSISSRISY